MNHLAYPNDRHKGFVILTGPNGQAYVPRFRDDQGPERDLAWCGACLLLGKRFIENQKTNKEGE